MYKIREMVIDDYDMIYKLWSTINGFRIRSIDDSKLYIDKFLKRNPGFSFVVEVNNIIVGSALVGSDGRTAGIYHFCISESYRNRGIGHALINKILTVLKKDGVSQVELVAFKDNFVGNKFWLNYGFKINNNLNYYSLNLNFQNYDYI